MFRAPSFSFSLILVAFAALFVSGCSPEAKAKRALENYEVVFRSCKQQTESEKMKPGEHHCSVIASMAVDLGMEQSTLEEPRRSEVLNAWLEKKQFVGYYVPKDKRPQEK